MVSLTDAYKIRLNNLRLLIDQWGGPGILSKKLGHASGSFLAQLAGPAPIREVTEKTARKIESKLDLPRGWLDTPHPGEAKPDVDVAKVTAIARMVAAVAEREKIKLAPDKFDDVVALAYESAGSTEPAALVERLLRLLR